ncbi:MAG: hypothetical protein ACK5JP_05220 [Akkermansiaceae bacterium]|jgi:hypothetical protein
MKYRASARSLEIQKCVNDLFISIITDMKKHINNWKKPGLFSTCLFTENVMNEMKNHLWSLEVNYRSGVTAFGKYNRAEYPGGGFSDDDFVDKTASQIRTLFLFHRVFPSKFSNGEKILRQMPYYPSIEEIHKINASYMASTYGSAELPPNIVSGFVDDQRVGNDFQPSRWTTEF